MSADMPTDRSRDTLIALLPQLGESGVDMLLPFLAGLRAEKGHVMVKQGDQDVAWPESPTGTEMHVLSNSPIKILLWHHVK